MSNAVAYRNIILTSIRLFCPLDVGLVLQLDINKIDKLVSWQVNLFIFLYNIWFQKYPLMLWNVNHYEFAILTTAPVQVNDPIWLRRYY